MDNHVIKHVKKGQKYTSQICMCNCEHAATYKGCNVHRELKTARNRDTRGTNLR